MFKTTLLNAVQAGAAQLQHYFNGNFKITNKEVSHIIDKFQKTFDSYWQSDDFELFDDAIHKEKLIESLNQGKSGKNLDLNLSFFDIKPFPF